MPRILNGRYTARMDEPFVGFIIGMRIHRFLAFRKWGSTMRAMGPMLRELYQHPEKGFLGVEFFPARRSLIRGGDNEPAISSPNKARLGTPLAGI